MDERRGGRLARDREHRWLGGVCAGLGRTYGVDATLVRVGFVALTLVGGAGIVAYLALWLLMPAGPSTEAATRDVMRENLDDIAERARRAADELATRARNASETAQAARLAADRLAEAARAAASAGREAWQQSGQTRRAASAEPPAATPEAGGVQMEDPTASEAQPHYPGARA